MLIPVEIIRDILSSANIHINGAFHIGAHNCEELTAYSQLGLSDTKIVWIDAIPYKVREQQQRGIPNVFNAIISEVDNELVEFHVSNNGQSSSLLELGTHAYEHPEVVYIDKIMGYTKTIDTFFAEHTDLDATAYNFWNFDIQGAELMALRGAKNSIRNAKAIYLEINEQELYKNCGLVTEIDAFLTEHNFRRVYTVMTPHGWGDALYILR